MSVPFWRKLGFERKLLVAFVLLAVLPSLLIMGTHFRRLGETIEMWKNPGVDRSLDASVAFLRETMAAREARNERTAEETLDLLVKFHGEGGSIDAGQALGRITARFGTDAPTDVRLWHEEAGRKTLLFSHETSHREEGPVPMRRLARASGDGTALIGDFGFTPPSEFVDRRETIADGYRYYLRLGVFEQLARGNLRLQAAGVLAVAVLLAFLVARVLSRSLSRPLLSLVEGTRRVREGDLEVRVTAESRDEVGRLVDSFNAMTRDLSESRDRLVRAERVAAWAAAARRIAHEIKNPLTPIALAIHRLARRTENLPEADRAVATECLDAILEEVGNLKSLAGEFSEFARLPSPKPAPMKINELLRRAASLYVEGTGVEVDWRLAEGDPEILADRELLWRVVTNLVKNAVEAMGGDGRLMLQSNLSAGGTVLIIEDSGPGIPEEERRRVFDPYYTTKATGSGLGLALVERIVHDHDGAVTVAEGSAGGARFEIRLPAGGSLPGTMDTSTIPESGE